MSIDEKLYGTANMFTWSAISIIYNLLEKSLIDDHLDEVNWVQACNSLANTLIDEYSEVPISLPNLMNLCEDFTAQILLRLQTDANVLGEKNSTLDRKHLLCWQYLTVLLDVFSLYEQLMTHKIIIDTEFYKRYQDIKPHLDELTILIENEITTFQNELGTKQEDKKEQTIQDVKLLSKSLFGVWEIAVKEYIGV